jgi:hypothetical protein
MSSIISKDKKIEHLKYIQLNFNKYSQRKIAKQLKIGKTTVNKWSNEVGLKFRKHTVNENFFDTLTEESAYILGLIFTDGNVAWDTKKGYYTLTITAAEKDKEHLEKIRKIMSSTKPLLYAPSTKSYRLIVNSKKICKKLIEYGVIPKKSLIVKFPEIPKEYLNHFLRGVIDGDGSVRYSNRKRSPFFDIMICSGSPEFCEKLVTEVHEAIDIDANIKKRKNANTYMIVYSCSRGKKLAEYIYSNSTIFLNRKYLVYKNNVLEGKNGKKL